MTRLTFAERPWRSYTLDGQKVPSVTTITGAALAKPGLMNAAAKEAAIWASLNTESLGTVLTPDAWIREASGAARRLWDRRALDGKILHTLAESMVLGAPMPTEADGEQVPEHVQRMAGQLARFFDAWDVAPIAIESMCFNEEYRYAGRWDLAAELAGTRWLLDYKTGESGVWQETSLQLSAYGHTTHFVDDDGNDRETASLGIERAGAVWVRPDSWQLVPVRYDAEVFRVFLHMGAVHAWSKMSREQSILPALPTPTVREPARGGHDH